MIRRRGYFTDPFTDLLFNALLGFTMLFMVTIMFVNPLAKLGSANLKAEFIITLSWPEDLPDDLDVWVEDPHGEVVSYLQKDAGWLHLDRDDRGGMCTHCTCRGSTDDKFDQFSHSVRRRH